MGLVEEPFILKMRIPPLCLKLLLQLFPFHPYPSFQKDGNGQRECMSIPWARSFPLHGPDAKAPILGPPDAKSQLIGKDSDVGKD